LNQKRISWSLPVLRGDVEQFANLVVGIGLVPAKLRAVDARFTVKRMAMQPDPKCLFDNTKSNPGCLAKRKQGIAPASLSAPVVSQDLIEVAL
jgi:hypothetical protein